MNILEITGLVLLVTLGVGLVLWAMGILKCSVEITRTDD